MVALLAVAVAVGVGALARSGGSDVAYAVDETTDAGGSSAEESSSSVVTHEVAGEWSDLGDAVTITYDGEAAGGAVAGSYTISQDAVAAYVESQGLITEGSDGYVAGELLAACLSEGDILSLEGSDELARSVEASLAELEDVIDGLATSGTGNTSEFEYALATGVDGGEASQVTYTALTELVEVTDEEGNVVYDEEGNALTTERAVTDGDGNPTYSVTVTNVTATQTYDAYSYSYETSYNDDAAYVITGYDCALALQGDDGLLVPSDENGWSVSAGGLTLTCSDGTYTVWASSDLGEGIALVAVVTEVDYVVSYSCSILVTTTTQPMLWTGTFTWTTTEGADGTPITSDGTGEDAPITAESFAEVWGDYAWSCEQLATTTQEEGDATSEGPQVSRTEGGSVAVSCAVSGATAATGVVTSVDAWASLSIPATLDDVGSLAYAGDDYVVEALTGLSGLTATVQASDCITATVGLSVAGELETFTLTLEPEHHTDDDVTVTITYAYPNGRTAGTTTVTVKGVAKARISGLSIDEQPFRLEAAQADEVLVLANEAVLQAVSAVATQEGDAVPTSDYYSAVSLVSYDGQGSVSQTVGLVFVVNDAAASEYDDFEVADAGSVTVAAIQSVAWSQTDIVLSATNGTSSVTVTSENASTQWVNSVPTVSSGTYELAYRTSAVPTDASGFDANGSCLDVGDGVHTVTMYALDSDGVVCKVTGISYMLDTLVPTLVSVSVGSDGSRSLADTLFGHESTTVELVVVDYADGAATATTDEVSTVASGVVASSVAVTYDDAESGTSGIAAALSVDGALYSFVIDGDEDVEVDDITVTATDVAGNTLVATANEASEIPVEYLRLVNESSGPSLTATWDTSAATNGSYYRTGRTLTLTVTEAFFDYTIAYHNDQVVLTVEQDGVTVIAVHPSDFSQTADNTWSCTLSFTEDGEYVVSDIVVSDIVGHSATAEGDAFTIDTTAPELTVSFDDEDVTDAAADPTTGLVYYSASRTATITVVDANFDASLVVVEHTADPGNGTEVGTVVEGSWVTSGNVSTLTVTFPGEGVYSLSVSGTDCAGNAMASYSSVEFVVDTRAPEVSVTGVADATAYVGSAALAVEVSDANLDPSTMIEVTKVGYPSSIAVVADATTNPYVSTVVATATTMSVSWASPAEVLANDGVYTLTVCATDRAGNVTSEVVTWSVNRYGSTYVIHDETGAMIGLYVRPDEVGDVIVSEINASGLDTGQTSVDLTLDTTTTTLVAGTDYTTDELVTDGWHEYVYTVGRSAFLSDGDYSVLFYSVDLAGNSSLSTMDGKNAEDLVSAAEVYFTVDGTSPTANFTDEVTTVDEGPYVATIVLEDNYALASAVIRVNGETYDSLDLEGAGSTYTYTLELAESDEAYHIEVLVYDEAGNSNESSPLARTITVGATAADEVVAQAVTGSDVDAVQVPLALVVATVLLLLAAVGLLVLWGRRTRERRGPARVPRTGA